MDGIETEGKYEKWGSVVFPEWAKKIADLPNQVYIEPKTIRIVLRCVARWYTSYIGKITKSCADELRTKKYIRKALQLGLSAGYLIPDENSESQVLRVASDIVNFGRPVEEGSGSDEKPDNSLTGAGRNRGGRGAGGKTAVKRLATKNRRQNMPKQVRSRTKSPARPAAQKRRRKRSDR